MQAISDYLSAPDSHLVQIDMRLSSFIFSFIFTLKIVSGSDVGSAWGYQSGYNFSDPQHWKNAFPICAGSSQSPIDVTTRYAQYNANLKPIIVTGAPSTTAQVNLEKHATSAYLTFGDQWNVMLMDRTCLKPVSIHWHWGSEAGKGSEHTMDTVRFPIEGHVITFNCNNYTTFDIAKGSPNGLYVFSILYEIGTDGSALQKVVDAMEPLISGGKNTVPLSEISLNDIFPTDVTNYYQYDGSLTTPPCTENVKWTLLKAKRSITLDQITKFRSLKFEAPEVGNMVNNFRPVYPMNGRIVFSSFKRGSLLKWSTTIIGLELAALFFFMIHF